MNRKQTISEIVFYKRIYIMINAANKLMNYKINVCTVAAMGIANDGGKANRQQPKIPQFRTQKPKRATITTPTTTVNET